MAKRKSRCPGEERGPASLRPGKDGIDKSGGERFCPVNIHPGHLRICATESPFPAVSMSAVPLQNCFWTGMIGLLVLTGQFKEQEV